MANYNTFILQDTKTGRALLVTSSARKVKQQLTKGKRVEVWSANEKVETLYERTSARLEPYVQAEREYIGRKQRAAEERNKRRRRA